jgi:hypothetical protein
MNERACSSSVPARSAPASTTRRWPTRFSAVVTDREVSGLAGSLHNAGIVLLSDHAGVGRHFQLRAARSHRTRCRPTAARRAQLAHLASLRVMGFDDGERHDLWERQRRR